MIVCGPSDLCDLSFPCTRKHPFKDKKYELYIYNKKLVIGQVNKCNKTFCKKYNIDLSGRLIIDWKLNNKLNLEAFGFLVNGKMKHFYSQKNNLLQLKSFLNDYVLFRNFHDFYIYIGTIDHGFTSTVILKFFFLYIRLKWLRKRKLISKGLQNVLQSILKINSSSKKRISRLKF